MRTITSLALGALLLFPISQSQADSIDIYNGESRSDDGPLGAFTGTLDYQITGQSSATLLLSLTNTSVASNGGYITAVALYDEGLTASGFSSSSANFAGLSGPIAVSPFPEADFGASATKDAWLGGGSPKGGIAVGQTVTFTWTLTGDVGSATASSFSDILVRFRGFEDGGSDKVVGRPSNPVPEPSSIALGLLGVGAVLARRKKKDAPAA